MSNELNSTTQQIISTRNCSIVCTMFPALIACLLLVATSAPPSEMKEIDADEYARAKAEFVLNFVRYAEWPEDVFVDEESPIKIVVLGDDRMTLFLRRTVEKRIDDRRIRLLQLEYPRPLPGQDEMDEATLSRFHERVQLANLLYVSETEDEHVDNILEIVKQRPILTVSDIPQFVTRGGMLGLVMYQDRVRFDANVKVMRQCGVTMSSHILRLARTVIGEEDKEDKEQKEQAGEVR